MNRRGALKALASWALLASAGRSFAQQPKRIGFLYFASRASAVQSGRYTALVSGLRALGYAEGRDFVMEARFGDGNAGAMQQLAKDLVSANVDVIVTGGTPAAKAAQRATSTIPIVFASSADPLRDGLVSSLARPEANVTGVTSGNAEIDVKHVELLKSMVPRLTKLALLANPANPGHAFRLKNVESAAAKAGISLLAVQAETAAALEHAMNSAHAGAAQAVIVLNDSFFLQNERLITQLALKHRLPSICGLSGFADAGGLASYGANLTANFRRAATYVDRLLKGAKPADLPVERPLTFDLVLNFKTAEALRLELPKEIVLMAARTIR